MIKKSVGKVKPGKKSLLNKITRQSLEDQVRQKTDELNVKQGQLQLGADREKIAEEQIHIRTKAMEAAADGIFIIEARNQAFLVVYANPSFYKITGYMKGDIIGKDYFLLYGPDFDQRVSHEIRKTLEQGKIFYGEMLSFKKNGEKFWCFLRISPVRDENGIVTHYVGIKTDTTLIKQRDMEIAEQREELLHVTRVGKLAEFVSSLAHEISQPLTAILSYAQAGQRLLVDREPQLHEILQFIISDDQRACEVIRRLRTLLKKTKPSLEPLDINILIRDTVLLIMPHITARNKVLVFNLAEDIPLTEGDRIQLQQVILNLISNSLEAMDERSDSRQLTLRTFLQDANSIMVEVTDSGCGIPEESLSKLFSHFFTSKLDGLGMGLSISRSIVEAHGGLLDARNNSGPGATFYFTLPVSGKDL
jgi:PAS domain S-box-containing protein